MTLHRKAHDNSHCTYTPALVRVAADHTRRLSAHHVSQTGHYAIGIVSQLHPQKGDLAACGYRDHSQNETAARRCVSALQVRSTVVLRGGVSSWEPKQRQDGRRCLGERFEQSFEETRGPNVCRRLAVSAAKSGATRSPTSSWRSAPAARSGPRSSISRASASLPMRCSWSCSTSCGRVSGRDINSVSDGGLTRSLPSGEIESAVTLASPPSESRCRSESNQRQVRSAGKPQGPRKTTVNPGRKVASRLADGRTSAARGEHPLARTPERKITASPRRSIAGVGTDGAASASASHLSYLLAPADPATDKGAYGDDRVHAPPAFNSESSEAAPPA